MSFYTAMEIIGWLLAACGLGAIMGWLLSRARSDGDQAREMEAANERARGSAAELAARQREIIQLTEQSQRVALEGRETAGALRVQLAAAQDHRDQARNTVSDARAELERQRAENRAQGEQLERVAKQLSDARGAIDHLTGECTNAQRLLAAAEVERDQALAELDIKRAALSSMNALQGQRDRAVGQADALSQRLDDALTRRAQAEDALAAARADLDRLNQRLSHPPADLAADESELAAAMAARTAERDALADSLHRLDGLYAAANQARAEAETQVASLTKDLEAERIDHAACRATLTAVLQERNHLRALRQSSLPPAAPAPSDAPQAEQVEQAQSQPKQPSAPEPAPAPKPTVVEQLDPRAAARALVKGMGEATAQDDLQALKGIGAKTARRLTGLGIVSFAQIAQLEPAGVQLIARAVGLSPERVLREKWPAQARAKLS